MTQLACTAPKRGHKPGSDQWRDCPACSAVPKSQWLSSLPTLKPQPGTAKALPDLELLNVSQRKELAADPETPKEILAELVCLGEPETVLVFSNPSIDPDILGKFASLASGRELMAIARNPRTPNYALMNIYREHYGSLALREAVAENPGLDEENIVSILMTKDSNSTRRDIYIKAASNISLTAEGIDKVCADAGFSGSLPLGTATALLDNPNALERHFDKLASKWRTDLVREVVRHPRLPLGSMEYLVRGGEAQDKTVLGALAFHPRLSDDLLDALADPSQDPYVVEQAKYAIFGRMKTRTGEMSDEALEYLIGNSDWKTVMANDPEVFVARTFYQERER